MLTDLCRPLRVAHTVMVGKWTADSLIDSLYHNLIELKCFPFLSDEPHVHECLDLHAVSEVMATDVITMPEIGACNEGPYRALRRQCLVSDERL